MKKIKNKLVLSNADIDNLLVSRWSEIEYFQQKHYADILSGEKTQKDITLFKGDITEDNFDEVMDNYILYYLEKEANKKSANRTLKHYFLAFRDKAFSLGKTLPNEDGEKDWYSLLKQYMLVMEKDIKGKIKATKQNKDFQPSHPKMREIKTVYLNTKSMVVQKSASDTKTHWETIARKWIKEKIEREHLDPKKKNDYYIHLKAFFCIVGKQYVEDITKQDCRKFSDEVFLIPKRWSIILEKDPSKDLRKLLHKNRGGQTLCDATIQAYLLDVKNFMKYAFKMDYIPHLYIDVMDGVKRTEELARESFTDEELQKIFYFPMYPYKYSPKDYPRFWIPLISLYQGMRLNEICQLYVEDIKKQENIWCFDINDKEDKLVKNKTSKRIIPIHPTLIKIGFLKFVEKQQHQGAKRLFPTLKKTERNGFGRSIGAWFARHLDYVGISGKDKVFHSFRHTFAENGLSNGILPIYQKKLGGWTNGDVAYDTYGRRATLEKLKQEISKIKYPCLKDSLEWFAMNERDQFSAKCDLCKQLNLTPPRRIVKTRSKPKEAVFETETIELS